MTSRTIARVMTATYAALLALWLLSMPLARRAFRIQPELREKAKQQDIDLPTAAGVLLVFLANIATELLVIFSLRSMRADRWLKRLRVPLPRIVAITGACLFVGDKAWGTLALFFNPGYSPFFARRRRSARLATRGPYALVRHPRYAGEAALNLILPVLTGVWLPWLGILGWPALRRQAQREESDLAQFASTAYGSYAAATPQFIPRPQFDRRAPLT